MEKVSPKWRIIHEGEYIDDQKAGEWKTYDTNGILIMIKNKKYKG